MHNLRFASAVELQALITQHQVSAIEVLEAHLEAIARFNPALNTIITLDEEMARQRAKEVDAGQLNQDGRFLGVPYTIKDMFDTAGVLSTFGYPPFKNRIPDRDSSVAAKMKEAGGVLLGKTNVNIIPDNPFGKTNNPWNLTRSAGGSSCGGAAVAAGLTPLDIGSDTGGSILNPSSQCGVFGMRPTEHRVSVAGFVIPEPVHIWRIMSVAGPIARNVADLRLALEILSGPDNRDHNVAPVSWKSAPMVSLKNLRVAWSDTFPGAKVARAIRQGVEKLAVSLEQAGANVQQIIPQVDYTDQYKLFLSLWELIIRAFAADLPPGKEALLKDYFLLLSRRDEYISIWNNFFSEWDVLLCPVSFSTAYPQTATKLIIDGEEVKLGEFVEPGRILALVGNPVIVVPAGKDQDGLPFGVGLVGKRWDDERLLAIASLIEEMLGGFVAPPGYD